MRIPFAAAAAVVAVLAAAPALAHPHVWVAVKAEAVLGADGKVVAIRHHWTFDDMYSAFVTANLGKDGQPPTSDDLQSVAQTNVESLKEFDYFTFGKLNGKPVKYSDPKEFSMTYDPKEEMATLHFTLPLAKPAETKKAFTFAVYDPSYFVAFSFDKGEPVRLDGGPKGCSMSVLKPHALDDEEQKKLNQAMTENFSPGEDFAFRLADRAIIACP
jgi:ABC-type uncharacterized transport system substrate-binding protein